MVTLLQTGNQVLVRGTLLEREGVTVHTINESCSRSYCKCNTISATLLHLQVVKRKELVFFAFCEYCCLLMENFSFHGVIGDAIKYFDDTMRAVSASTLQVLLLEHDGVCR